MIKLGCYPSNVKVVEGVIKRNNVYIAALRKQLKLPPTEHPKAKKFVQEECQKDDMMNLILQLTTQITEMEIQIDTLVHER